MIQSDQDRDQWRAVGEMFITERIRVDKDDASNLGHEASEACFVQIFRDQAITSIYNMTIENIGLHIAYKRLFNKPTRAR